MLGTITVCGRRPTNFRIERPRARYVRTVRAAKNTPPQIRVPSVDFQENPRSTHRALTFKKTPDPRTDR